MGEKNFFGVSLRAFAELNEQNIDYIDIGAYIEMRGWVIENLFFLFEIISRKGSEGDISLSI